jgi:hypothetical protein
MRGRYRFEQSLSSEERLDVEAKQLRQEASCLPPGREREFLLRKARQDEITSHLTEWLSSPGLQSPTR